MALSLRSQKKIQKLIFERAYEIETYLSEHDFLVAKLFGLEPYQVEDTALRIATKELQKEFSQPLS